MQSSSPVVSVTVSVLSQGGNGRWVLILDININSQIDRVKNRKNRPLLNNKSLKDNLLSLKKIRDPIYKKISNYIIDVSGKERDQVINEIQKII